MSWISCFFLETNYGEKTNTSHNVPCDFWRFLPILKIPITEDWSESWSLEAGTLQVEMSIAICGQDGDVESFRWPRFQYGKEPLLLKGLENDL